MVALLRTSPIDLDDSPEDARLAIRRELKEDPKATGRIYAALAGKTWSLLVERRFDAQVRDWHALVENVKARVKRDDTAAAERLTALSDLLWASVAFGETSPARAVAARPRARAILERLARQDGYVKRRELKNMLGLQDSNLSNILTKLVANDLVERREEGKQAEFRITRTGREAIGVSEPPIGQWPQWPQLDRGTLFGAPEAMSPPDKKWMTKIIERPVRTWAYRDELDSGEGDKLPSLYPKSVNAGASHGTRYTLPELAR